jgi:Xaa-Pro dipeptidase
VKEADYYGLLHVETHKSILFIPRLPAEYAVWMGKIDSTLDVLERYGVNEVHYVDEIQVVVKALNPDIIFTLKGKNTDSGEFLPPATFNGMDEFQVNHGRLWEEIVECRVIKTDEELKIMQYANQVSSAAHLDVMRKVKPGMMEYELESLFHFNTYSRGGCRQFAYTPICASGPNAAILHYGHAGAPNDRELQDGDMLLLDMGGEYYCYSSDITKSFPVNGKFTPAQRDVYETVLAAKHTCLKVIRAGVCWEDIHRLADKTIVAELLARGYLTGDLDEMVKAHVGALFMPHGVGHFLGLDTHDVGGYPRGTFRLPEPGIKSLRTRRVLEPGMVLTVEPGCYFIPCLLEPAFEDEKVAKFLNVEKLRPMIGTGGVRLEDNIIVTADGLINMTSGPQSVEEIEAEMAH